MEDSIQYILHLLEESTWVVKAYQEESKRFLSHGALASYILVDLGVCFQFMHPFFLLGHY